jgi:hypothetical protein
MVALLRLDPDPPTGRGEATTAYGALETSAAPPTKVRSLNRNQSLGDGSKGYCSCPRSRHPQQPNEPWEAVTRSAPAWMPLVCEEPTYAVQQKPGLFDDLVGAVDQPQGHRYAKRVGGLQSSRWGDWSGRR